MTKQYWLTTIDPAARAVLVFWFGEPGAPEYGQQRAVWFQKDPMFDALVRRRFGVLHEEASRGEWDSWQQHPETLLALLILLDQFSRHIYRDSRYAFATDERAVEMAIKGIELGFDQQVMPVARAFYYLPLEHSENLAYQTRSVALFNQLQAESSLYTGFAEYAQKHYDVIAQFGRFPHRNAVLGRVSSIAEQQYLNQPGAGF